MRLILKTVCILLLCFIISCKKDKKDTIPPIISITYPTAGQAYKMFDTISVNAHVSDNEHLSSVSVTITDMNHVPQQGSINASIPSADFILTMNYILTQFHLQSGNYYLQIIASDGYNTTSAYQQIYITASPTQLWGYCAVLKSSIKTISYYDTASASSMGSIMLSVAYNGMKYGGYNAQLYVNGSGNGTLQPFKSYNMQQLAFGSLNYNESDNNNTYSCLYTDGYKPYVGFNNGDIRSYQNDGSQGTPFRYSPSNAAYPYYISTTSLYGVAAFRNTIGSPNDELVTFTMASGSPFNSFPLYTSTPIKSIVAVFEKSQDSLYVLANDTTNNAVVYIYQPSENSMSGYSLIAPSSGKILSAVKVNNEYIIFTTTTTVYACNGLSLNLVSGMGAGAQKLCYQPALNMLTAATSTSTMANIKAYTVGTNSLTLISTRSQLTFSGDSLIDFEVITNK